MTVQIQDPLLWAKSNSYELAPLADPKFTAVSFRGQAVGVLRKVGDYFEFKTAEQAVAQPEQDMAMPATKVPSLADMCTSSGMVSQSFGIPGLAPIALDQLALKGTNELNLSSKISGTGHSERVLDCNYWLPYAAEHYNVSRDIRDYVLVPIPAIFSNLPNTNGDSLSLAEMRSFKPDRGMQMYKTFKGKPTFEEHDNKDITKAKGIILESFLRPVPFNPHYYKIVLLQAFDRTKDSALVEQILSRQHNAYSVGFYYASYACSICGHVVGKGINLTPCAHTQMFKPTYKMSDGRLAFRRCMDAEGFECSVVKTPAFVSAIGPYVMDPRNL